MQDGLDPTPGINNQFATIPDVPVEAVANRVAPRQVASGVTRGIQQLGGENVYSDGGNSQIIVKDTVPRVLMGNQTTFGEGFYVSKSGIDATTNTDPAQWIFNSNQNVFKIVNSGTTTIPDCSLTVGAGVYGTNSSLVTVPHSLGYVPGILSYTVDSTNFYKQIPVSTYKSISSGGFLAWNIYVYIDSTNIYFVNELWGINQTGSTGAIGVKYYLLQETAT